MAKCIHRCILAIAILYCIIMFFCISSTLATSDSTTTSTTSITTSMSASTNAPKIDAVMLTTGKDTRVFEKSIASAMRHLVDVNNFYIICPNAVGLAKKLGRLAMCTEVYGYFCMYKCICLLACFDCYQCNDVLCLFLFLLWSL